ncbi:MAG: NAD-dependent epimerase/dehydratase family protein, partial [Elusimicrobiota bacterium]
RIETLHPAVKDVDFVFHSAGVLRATHSDYFYYVNQTGTKNLIESAYRLNPNVKRFVYFSSQAAMGPSETCDPKNLDEKCQPVSEYGKSKLAGEQEVLKFSSKMPVVILRPSAIYGPRDKDIFPFFKIVSRFKIFPVLSPSNKCVVQLLFIQDLSEICERIVKQQSLRSNIYFVSENKFYTWQEIGKIISGAIGIEKMRIIRIPPLLVRSAAAISELTMKLKNKPSLLNKDKLNELCQTYWLGDSSAVEKDFNFKFTSLETGAKITYNWYKENNWL